MKNWQRTPGRTLSSESVDREERRHVFRGNEVGSCAKLRVVNLTARNVLSHRALSWKLKEIEV